MFSENATKIDKIFTVDLTVTTYCQIDGEDFVNFCGLLRKRELYNAQKYLGMYSHLFPEERPSNKRLTNL